MSLSSQSAKSTSILELHALIGGKSTTIKLKSFKPDKVKETLENREHFMQILLSVEGTSKIELGETINEDTNEHTLLVQAAFNNKNKLSELQTILNKYWIFGNDTSTIVSSQAENKQRSSESFKLDEDLQQRPENMEVFQINADKAHRRVYVKVHPSHTRKQLFDHFVQFGDIQDFDFKYNHMTHIFRNFCYITFLTEKSAQQVVNIGKHLVGKKYAFCEMSQPKLITVSKSSPMTPVVSDELMPGGGMPIVSASEPLNMAPGHVDDDQEFDFAMLQNNKVGALKKKQEVKPQVKIAQLPKLLLDAFCQEEQMSEIEISNPPTVIEAPNKSIPKPKSWKQTVLQSVAKNHQDQSNVRFNLVKCQRGEQDRI